MVVANIKQHREIRRWTPKELIPAPTNPRAQAGSMPHGGCQHYTAQGDSEMDTKGANTCTNQPKITCQAGCVPHGGCQHSFVHEAPSAPFAPDRIHCIAPLPQRERIQTRPSRCDHNSRRSAVPQRYLDSTVVGSLCNGVPGVDFAATTFTFPTKSSSTMHADLLGFKWKLFRDQCQSI